MIVLLPEGRAVCNADSTKLVKIVPSDVQGKKSYIVLVKLDDDAELMIKTVESHDEALAVADDVTNRLNDEEGDDDAFDDTPEADDGGGADGGGGADDDWGDEEEESSW